MFSQVVMVGAGNVASHLSSSLSKVIGEQLAFYNIKRESSLSMSKFHGGKVLDNLEALDRDSLIIVAIPDDAIPEFIERLPTHLSVVHTSGSVPLFPRRKNSGVFYPLQTFTKGIPVNMSEVPFCIEASPPDFEAKLLDLAKMLSDKVKTVNSADRTHLHLAAVVACNFSNHLFLLAENYLKEHHLSLDMLLPLIKETAQKAQRLSPKAAQTGPAVRRDQNTINKHLDALESKPELRELYADFTKRIQHEHGQELQRNPTKD